MPQIKIYSKSDPTKTTMLEQSTWDKFKDTSYKLWTNVGPSASAPTPAATPAPASTPAPAPSTSSDTSTWGINPANQPATPAPAPTAQPPALPQKEFYRRGVDIFEAGTDRRIGSTEWGKDWTGQATEISAPTQPAPAPEITADVFKDEEDLTIENDEKLTLIENINKSFGVNPNLSANPAFIHGVAKLAGREATPEELAMAGQSISRIAEHFGITGMLDNYGMNETVDEVGKSKEQTITDLKAKAESGVKLSPTDEANWEYATGNKDYPAPGALADAPSFDEAKGKPDPQIGSNAVSDMYDELIAEKQEGMLEGVDMTEFMIKKNEANLVVETARQAIADKQLLDAVELENISNQAIPMTLISRQQHKYTGDEYITNLKMAQDYNNKLILSKMAEGNFLEAQRITKDIANDNYEINKLQLDQLIYNDKIKSDEYDRMQREIDWERKLAVEYGYSYIPDMDTYNAIVKEYNITPANFNNFIYKEGDKMYLKNLKVEDDYQFVKATDDQPAGVFNIATGIFTPMQAEDGVNTITSQSGKIYDLSTYAADPVAHSNAVQNILNNIGKFDNITDIANYIHEQQPNSPIMADMIANASEMHNVGWEELTALMQHEALLGTSNVAVNNNNPGGITWSETYQASHPEVSKGTARPAVEGGNYVKFNTMQDGVNAVAEQLSRRVVSGAVQELSAEDISAVNKLAKDTYGASTIKTKDGYANFVEPLLERRRAGETIDDIADDLRWQGQSLEFTGHIRDAAQQITSKLSAPKTEIIFDKIDDLVGREDQGALRDYLKKTAIDAAGMEQGKQIMGQERTVEFLDEIFDDLKAFEDGGGDTNIFTGTMEEINRKAGLVKEPELRKIAVKVTKARQQYRRAMTGVAFSPGENLEYDKIFPDINKTAEFNTAVIKGLQETFRGDVDFFYGFQMGKEAYDEIFKGKTSQINDELTDEEAYEEYLKIKG